MVESYLYDNYESETVVGSKFNYFRKFIKLMKTLLINSIKAISLIFLSFIIAALFGFFSYFCPTDDIRVVYYPSQFK